MRLDLGGERHRMRAGVDAVDDLDFLLVDQALDPSDTSTTALLVCAPAEMPRPAKSRGKISHLLGFIGIARFPVYRFVSNGSNTFLTLSATRPRRSRRIQSVPFGSSRNPSFRDRMNFTRFSGDSGVSG